MAIPRDDNFWYGTVKQNSLTGQWNNQQKKDAYEGFALAQLRAKYENLNNEQVNADRVRSSNRADSAQQFDQSYKTKMMKNASDANVAKLFTTVGGLALQNSDKLFGTKDVMQGGVNIPGKEGMIPGAINKVKGWMPDFAKGTNVPGMAISSADNININMAWDEGKKFIPEEDIYSKTPSVIQNISDYAVKWLDGILNFL
jgi:hypothetical protein